MFDPPGDGNCQFHAISHALNRFGIYRSAQTLRADIINYLENNENDRDGWPLELFMGMPFSDYLSQMSRDSTYGDQLTLRAASDIYNVDFTIISTLGAQGRINISPASFNSLGTIVLGHFAEGYGEHYVLLTNSGTARIENEDIDLNTKERGSSEEKIKIVDIIESEEKTEILTSGKIMTFDVFLYTVVFPFLMS